MGAWSGHSNYGGDIRNGVAKKVLKLCRAFRRARLLTVEPVIFLYMFGMFLSSTLYQQYYMNRYSLVLLRNTSYPYFSEARCVYKEDVTNYTGDPTAYGKIVLGNATLLFVFRSLASQIPAVIVTILLGPLSDRYGRCPVILLVAFGAVLHGYVNLSIVHFKLDMQYFILSGVIEGVTGGLSAITMACYSYVSDISSEKWRTMRIGLVQSMLYVAGIMSRGLGLLWFQKLNCDITYPLILFMACNAAIIVYTTLFLPESLTAKERRKKNINKPKGPMLLARGISIFLCRVKEYPVWRLWLALVPIMFMTMIMTAETATGIFYFGAVDWKPVLIGINQALAMGSHMVSAMVVLPILVALKLPDPLISLIGAIANCSMNFFIGLSRYPYELFIVAVIQGMDAVMGSPLRGYMSKLVHVKDQGALFSVVGSVESIVSILSIGYPYILPILEDHNLSPGTAFLILSAFGLVSIVFISSLLAIWCWMNRCQKYARVHLQDPITSTCSEKTPILVSYDKSE